MKIFLINEKAEGWKNGIAFENYLREHPEELARYQKFKESLSGLSTREYYTKKLEFFNKILNEEIT